MISGAQLAGRIDQAFLKVDSSASVEALETAAQDALAHCFRSLCVMPLLVGTLRRGFPELRVCAVLSYPLGMDSLHIKKEALLQLIEHGAHEIDVVLDLFALVNGNIRKIELEARELGELASAHKVYLKAIIETPILTTEQIVSASHALLESPVDCIKSSTGHHREPTRAEDIRLIRGVVGQHKRIKASGGIKTLTDARLMLTNGADIIGTSSGAALVAEAQQQSMKEEGTRD